MADVVIVAHHDRLEAAALAAAAADWLVAHGHQPWMPVADAEALSLSHLGAARPAGTADLALSLGGDGTMLRTVNELAGAPVPIVGVNVGLLGYLAEVEPGSMIPALDRWLHDARGSALGDEGGSHIEERMMLEITLRASGAQGEQRWTALNEAVIEKHEPGHTVRLLVNIDGSPFTSYAADGLIVATPTGSTAYSLSARGPVVSPRHRAMLLTPVSPHMLFDRSLVLDPEEAVDIELIGHRSAVLSIDGRLAASLEEGAVIAVRPSPHVARFVRFGRRRFHQILKTKFGLADR